MNATYPIFRTLGNILCLLAEVLLAAIGLVAIFRRPPDGSLEYWLALALTVAAFSAWTLFAIGTIRGEGNSRKWVRS